MQLEYTSVGEQKFLSTLDEIISKLSELSKPRPPIQLSAPQISQITSSLNSLSKQIASLNQAKPKIQISANLSQVDKELQTVQKSSSIATNQITKTGAAMQTAAQQSASLSKNIAPVNAESQNLSSTFNGVVKVIDSMSQRLQNTQGEFQTLKQGASGASTSITTLARAYGVLEPEINSANSVLPGLWENLVKVERTSQQAYRMTNMFGRSAQTLERMAYITPLLTELGAQFGTVGPEATKSSVAVSRFMLKASREARAVDEMTKGLSSVHTEFARLEAGSSRLKNIISFKEGFSGLAELPRVLTTLGKNTLEADRRFSKLEKTISETTGEAVNLRGKLAEISPQYKLLSTGFRIVDRLKASFKLLSIAIIGLSAVSPRSFATIIKGIQTVASSSGNLTTTFTKAGTLISEFSTNSDNALKKLSTRIEAFSQPIRSVFGSIHEVFLGSLSKISSGLESVSGRLLEAGTPKTQQASTGGIGGFVDAAKAKGATALGKALQFTGNQFERFRTGLQASSDSSAGFFDRLTSLSDASIGLANIISTNPIPLLSSAFKLLSGDTEGAIKGLLKFGKQVIVSQVASRGLNAALKLVSDQSARAAVIDKISEYLQRAGISMKDVGDVFVKVWKSIIDIVSSATQFLGNLFQKIESGLAKSESGKKLLSLFQSFRGAISVVWNMIKAVFSGLAGDAGKAGGIIGGLVQKFSGLKDAASGVKEGIKSGLGKMSDVIGGPGTPEQPRAPRKKMDISKIFTKEKFDFIPENVTQKAGKLTSIFKGITSAVQQVASVLRTSFIVNLNVAIETIKSLGKIAYGSSVFPEIAKWTETISKKTTEYTNILVLLGNHLKDIGSSIKSAFDAKLLEGMIKSAEVLRDTLQLKSPIIAGTRTTGFQAEKRYMGEREGQRGEFTSRVYGDVTGKTDKGGRVLTVSGAVGRTEEMPVIERAFKEKPRALAEYKTGDKLGEGLRYFSEAMDQMIARMKEGDKVRVSPIDRSREETFGKVLTKRKGFKGTGEYSPFGTQIFEKELSKTDIKKAQASIAKRRKAEPLQVPGLKQLTTAFASIQTHSKAIFTSVALYAKRAGIIISSSITKGTTGAIVGLNKLAEVAYGHSVFPRIFEEAKKSGAAIGEETIKGTKQAVDALQRLDQASKETVLKTAAKPEFAAKAVSELGTAASRTGKQAAKAEVLGKPEKVEALSVLQDQYINLQEEIGKRALDTASKLGKTADAIKKKDGATKGLEGLDPVFAEMANSVKNAFKETGSRMTKKAKTIIEKMETGELVSSQELKELPKKVREKLNQKLEEAKEKARTVIEDVKIVTTPSTGMPRPDMAGAMRKPSPGIQWHRGGRPEETEDTSTKKKATEARQQILSKLQEKIKSEEEYIQLMQGEENAEKEIVASQKRIASLKVAQYLVEQGKQVPARGVVSKTRDRELYAEMETEGLIADKKTRRRKKREEPKAEDTKKAQEQETQAKIAALKKETTQTLSQIRVLGESQRKIIRQGGEQFDATYGKGAYVQQLSKIKDESNKLNDRFQKLQQTTAELGGESLGTETKFKSHFSAIQQNGQAALEAAQKETEAAQKRKEAAESLTPEQKLGRRAREISGRFEELRGEQRGLTKKGVAKVDEKAGAGTYANEMKRIKEEANKLESELASLDEGFKKLGSSKVATTAQTKTLASAIRVEADAAQQSSNAYREKLEQENRGASIVENVKNLLLDYVGITQKVGDTQSEAGDKANKMGNVIENVGHFLLNFTRTGSATQASILTLGKAFLDTDTYFEMGAEIIKKISVEMTNTQAAALFLKNAFGLTGKSANFLNKQFDLTSVEATKSGKFLSNLAASLGAIGRGFLKSALSSKGFTTGISKLVGGKKTLLGQMALMHPAIAGVIAGFKAWQAVGQIVTKVISKIIAVLKDILQVGGKVQTQFLRTFSLLKASGEADKFPELSEHVKTLGSTTEWTTEQVAKASNSLLQLGLSSDQTKAALKGVIDAASANQIPLEQAARVAANTMNQFGRSAEEIPQILGALSAIAFNTGADFNSLGMSLRNVGKAADTLGMSVEETSAALGVFGNVAIRFGRAGTTLRNILTRMAAPPATARKAFKELGIEIFDENGKFRKFSDIINDVSEKFKTLDDAQKAMYSKMIAGQRSFVGFLTLVDTGKDKLDELTEKAKQGGKINEEMAERFRRGWEGTIKAFESAVEGIKLSGFDMIAEVATESLRVAVSGVRLFGKGLNYIKPIIAGLSSIFAELIKMLRAVAKAFVNAVSSTIGWKATVIIANTIRDSFIIIIDIVKILIKFITIGFQVIGKFAQMIGGAAIGSKEFGDYQRNAADGMQLWAQNVDTMITKLDNLQTALDKISIENFKNAVALFIGEIGIGLFNLLADVTEKIPAFGKEWADGFRTAAKDIEMGMGEISLEPRAGTQTAAQTGDVSSAELEAQRIAQIETKRLQGIQEKQEARKQKKFEMQSTAVLYKQWLEEDVNSEKWSEIDALLKKRSNKFEDKLSLYYEDQADILQKTGVAGEGLFDTIESSQQIVDAINKLKKSGELTAAALEDLGVTLPDTEEAQQALIEQLKADEAILEYDQWFQIRPSTHLSIEEGEEIIGKQDALEESRRKREERLLKEKDTWELLLELETIDIASDQAVNILTELHLREDSENLEEQLEKIRAFADEQREKVKDRAREKLGRKTGAELALELDTLDPTSKEFAQVAGELFSRGEQEQATAFEAAQRAYEIDVEIEGMDKQKNLLESTNNLTSAMDQFKEKQYEVATFDLKSKLGFEEIGLRIQKYLIEPFSYFNQQLGQIAGKFADMIQGIQSKGVDIKEKFGLYGTAEEQEKLVKLQDKLAGAKTDKQRQRYQEQIEKVKGGMGEGLEKEANKERLQILERRERVLQRQLGLVEQSEEKAGLFQQLAELLTQKAEVAPEGGRRFAQQAVQATQQAEGYALQAEDVEVQRLELEKESTKRQESFLKSMLSQAPTAAVRTGVLEQMLPLLEKTGNVPELIQYQEELAKSTVEKAKEQEARETERLELARQSLETQKLQAERLQLILTQNSEALNIQRKEAVEQPTRDPRLNMATSQQNPTI